MKQTGRESDMRQAGRLMKKLLLAFRSRMDEELRPQAVTAAQLRLLQEVRMRPGASGAEVARVCGVTPQTSQAMLARAVQRGWIERGKDAENDRLVTSRLTAEGERILAHGDKIARAIESTVWRGIAPGEIAALTRVLERGLANLAAPERSEAGRAETDQGPK